MGHSDYVPTLFLIFIHSLRISYNSDCHQSNSKGMTVKICVLFCFVLFCFVCSTAATIHSKYIQVWHIDNHWFQLSLNRQEEENVRMIFTHVYSRNVSSVSWDQWVCLQSLYSGCLSLKQSSWVF